MNHPNRQSDGLHRPNQPLSVSPKPHAKDQPLNVTLVATVFESRDLKATKEEAAANRFQHKHLQVAHWQVRDLDGSYDAPVWDQVLAPDDMHHTSGKLVFSNKPHEVTLPYGVLNPSSTYFWRVRYQASDDLWSEWSEEASFSTSPFVVQPYLQHITQESIAVMWEDHLLKGHVRYGLDESCQQEVSGTSQPIELGTFIHQATLDGLTPQTVYHYQVVSGSHVAPTATFRTAPHRDTPFAFAVWADSQTGPQIFETLLDHMVAADIDFAIGVGDMATDGGQYDHVHNYHVGPLAKKFAGRIPWCQTWGSHDGRDRIIYDYVSLPDRSGSFSFNYGNSHFTLLSIHNLDAAHVEWLKADLASDAAQSADFRFFFVHNPPYCILWLDGDAWLREHVVPLLEAYHVDFVFSGHTHDYERGLHNGIYYVVTGGGSWLDHHEPVVGQWSFLKERMVMDHEFILITIDGGTLEYRAINDEGDAIDIIRKER